MYNIVSSLLRYIFITIIYAFIFGIIRMIYLDIRNLDVPGKSILPTKYPYLLYRNPSFSEENQVYALNRRDMTIGRGTRCDIVLQDMMISKKHLRVWYQDKEWHLEDLDSKNGTYINGELLDGIILLDEGDTIKLGNVELEFYENR